MANGTWCANMASPGGVIAGKGCAQLVNTNTLRFIYQADAPWTLYRVCVLCATSLFHVPCHASLRFVSANRHRD